MTTLMNILSNLIHRDFVWSNPTLATVACNQPIDKFSYNGIERSKLNRVKNDIRW